MGLKEERERGRYEPRYSAAGAILPSVCVTGKSGEGEMKAVLLVM
jgi:hypothetical protein